MMRWWVIGVWVGLLVGFWWGCWRVGLLAVLVWVGLAGSRCWEECGVHCP